MMTLATIAIILVAIAFMAALTYGAIKLAY
jgi:hypothetical protein